MGDMWRGGRIQGIQWCEKHIDMCNKKTKQNKNFPAKSESTYFPKDGSAMPQQILLLHFTQNYHTDLGKHLDL